MFLDTQPAALGPVQPGPGGDPWGEFRVAGSHEILGLMRALRDGSVPVHLSSSSGHAMAAVLWSVDGPGGRLSFSADDGAPHLQAFVEADEATAVAYLDSVKLQFDLQGMVMVRSARSSALQCTMPRELYRFQRRGAFRVRPAERSAPGARLRHPSIPDMAVALRVLDVSIGGCALLLPADVPPVAAGVQIHGVRIDLDADTRFMVALQVQHVGSLAGASGLRLGCEWQQIDGHAQRALQRYIDQVQKRRRLLTLG